MKKNRPKTGDRSLSVSRKELALVRGGGIEGTGHATNSGVIHGQNENGVIHTP